MNNLRRILQPTFLENGEAADATNAESQQIDFLIITPLAEEREAVLSKLPVPTRLPPSKEDIRVYYRSTLPVGFSDGSTCNYAIIVTDLLGMGRVEAANCVGDAVRRWQPRYVLLVGIAGGVSEAGIILGDVLVADQIADYEVQKLAADGPSIRWQVHRVDPRLFTAANQLKAADWQPLIAAMRPDSGSATQHFGPVCTGDKVVANGLIDDYREVWAKLIGVEMEAGGVASALVQTASKPGLLMIRGVSDLADKDKETSGVKAWRSYACDVAAAFTVAFLRSGPIPPDTRQIWQKTATQLRPESPRADLRTARLDEMEAISFGRCVERWQAVGVPRSVAVRLAKDRLVGEPTTPMLPTSDKPLVVLVGEIGSGKTLIAHRLFQAAINRAKTGTKAPWPIFIEAKEAVFDLREIVQKVATKPVSTQDAGAFLIIDGADEAGFTAIDQLLSEARTLTAVQRPPMFVVITSRPLGGLHEKAKEEIVEVPPLSKQSAWTIITDMSRRNFDMGMTLSWPESLREAVRRPLFAILFGLFLRSHYGRVSFSIGEVLAHLVERAIENMPLNKTNVQLLLEKLARLSIERGGIPVPMREVGTRRELEPLLESRLIVEHGGAIHFPLAILCEWFGAQALISDKAALNGLLNAGTLFDSWRNSLIIAVASFDHSRVGNLLKSLAEKHPGVVSQIVDKALVSWGIHEESFAPPVLECGRRIRETMQSWVKGIGRLAALTAPIRKDGSVRSIGVKLDGAALTTSWYEGDQEMPDVVELSMSDLENQTISNGWPGQRWARPTRQSAWAWKWTLEELTDRISRLVREHKFPVVDGPIIDELLWPQLVALSRRRLSMHKRMQTPFKTEITLIEIEELIEPHMKGNWHFTGGWCNLEFVRTELARARSQGVTAFRCPWPVGDQEYRGSVVGSNYSDAQLLQRASVVYQQALVAYRQIVEEWLTALAPRLQTYVLMPVRIVGTVIPYTEYVHEGMPSLGWYVEPLETSAASVVDFKIGHDGNIRPDDQYFRKQKAILTSRRPGTEKWISPSFQSGRLDIFGACPVTKLAYEWLWTDLEKIAWVK